MRATAPRQELPLEISPRGRAVRRLFLGVCLALLFVPPVARLLVRVAAPHYPPLRLLSGPRLTGVSAAAPLPRPSVSAWLSGEFQEGMTRWAAQNEGPRRYLVRLYNQLNYSLLRHSSMEGVSVLVGRNGALFDRGGVEDFHGLRPPSPPEEFEALAERLERLQAHLERRGITFVLLITPSKPAVYPELVPKAFSTQPARFPRDYHLLLPLLKRRSVRYVDGPEITREAARRETAPLFCHGSVHWNHLAAFYTGQSLLDTIGKARGEAVPRLELTHKRLAPQPRYFYDRDLAQLLNVLSPPVRYPAPEIGVRAVPQRPVLGGGKMLFAGSSFNWMLLDTLSASGAVQEADLFFYYRSRFRYTRHSGWLSDKEPPEEPLDRRNIDWERDVLSARALVIEFNEADLKCGPGTHHHAFLTDLLAHLERAPGNTQALRRGL